MRRNMTVTTPDVVVPMPSAVVAVCTQNPNPNGKDVTAGELNFHRTMLPRRWLGL